MYECINGWTRERMLEKVRARPTDGPAMDGGQCAYKAPDGSRCAMGMFVPDGHEAEGSGLPAELLLDRYPDLVPFMPLPGKGMREFQMAHDEEGTWQAKPHAGNAKSAMLAWIEANVNGGGE